MICYQWPNHPFEKLLRSIPHCCCLCLCLRLCICLFVWFVRAFPLSLFLSLSLRSLTFVFSKLLPKEQADACYSGGGLIGWSHNSLILGKRLGLWAQFVPRVKLSDPSESLKSYFLLFSTSSHCEIDPESEQQCANTLCQASKRAWTLANKKHGDSAGI